MALIFGVSAAQAQLVTTEQFTTAGNGQHQGRCEPFTGCNNIDTWQTLIKRDPLFVGKPTLTVTGIAVKSFNNSFASATFSNVRITLGTRTANSLGSNFANNVSNPQVVFQGPLTLVAGTGGSIVLPVTTPYVYSPGLSGNLVVWWQNLGGEGKGAISQFVDFEGGVNGDLITAYFAPSNANGNLASTASTTTANRFLASGPVTHLTATFDQTNLTNIFAPAGGNSILNTPHIKKFATLAAAGTFSVEACLVRDPRFNSSTGGFDARPQLFSGLQAVAGSCGFLQTSPLRFPKWVQAAAPGRLPTDTQSYHYIGITHADTSALTLEDVIVTDQSELVTGLFGVVYDAPGAGTCSDSNIFRRPIAVGGEHTAGQNTDVRPTHLFRRYRQEALTDQGAAASPGPGCCSLNSKRFGSVWSS